MGFTRLQLARDVLAVPGCDLGFGNQHVTMCPITNLNKLLVPPGYSDQYVSYELIGRPGAPFQG